VAIVTSPDGLFSSRRFDDPSDTHTAGVPISLYA